MAEAGTERTLRHMTWDEAMALGKDSSVLFKARRGVLRRGIIHRDPRKVLPGPGVEGKWMMLLIRYNSRRFLPAFWRGDGWSPSTAIPLVEEFRPTKQRGDRKR